MLNLGLIGTGRVAQEHARGARDAGSRIACVYDAEPGNAERFAREHGAAVASSLDELLSRGDIPAVVVAVPNAWHREAAVACLEAGRDILLEKPMAMNVAECDAIIAAMERAGRFVQMGFVCRGAPRVEHVRGLAQGGELGTIYHARVTLCRRRGIPGLGRWFTTRALSGGGVVIDMGVHFIDLVMHITGERRALTVSGACESRFGSPIADYEYTEMWAGPPDPNGTFDVEDSASAFIRFEGGLTLDIHLAWAANAPEHVAPDGVLLLGERGGCFFDLWGEHLIVTRQVEGALLDTRPEVSNADAWRRAWQVQHERFAAAVLHRSEPAATAAHGRAVQQIVDALYASSAAGREVVIA
jgi:predicted dehydrogenase